MDPKPAKPKPDYRKPQQILVVCIVIIVTTLARMIFYPMDTQMTIVFGVLLVGAIAGAGIMYRDMKRNEKSPPPSA